METIAVPASPTNPTHPTNPRQLVAPLWHTALFIAAIAAFAAFGAVFSAGAAPPGAAAHRSSPVPLYLSLIALEYGFVVFVSRGVRQSGTTIRDLIGGRWSSPVAVIRDIVLAAAVWCIWTGVQMAWQRVHPSPMSHAVVPMLPQNPVEAILWVVVSISAGFAEELAFRGYLQRQLAAITGSTALAIVLQACVFGLAHGYQGAEACLRIAAYGALFGVVAAWRKSLRAGMIAHAWTDAAAGLLHI